MVDTSVHTDAILTRKKRKMIHLMMLSVAEMVECRWEMNEILWTTGGIILTGEY
jgi:hypothetical protein